MLEAIFGYEIDQIHERFLLSLKYQLNIVLIDAGTPPGSSFLTPSDLDGDAIHPNDVGYPKMAAIWLQAIEQANSEGPIRIPNETIWFDDGGDEGGDNTWEKEYCNRRGPIDTQAGSGLDGGIHRHASQSIGTN
ncbi:hypothetical protein DL768_004914 [Monosporascus sp. mg162]|nr:hypothetical protein DL768_004914 [Monosporascus sp. mg162]